MSQVSTQLRDECTGPAVTVVPGMLRGFRWFSFSERSPLGLGSVRLNQLEEGIPWRPTMRAECYPNRAKRWYRRQSCQAPNEEPSHWCGLYGWYSPHRMTDMVDFQHKRVALGVIEAWGTILLGGQGFRAERARVLAVAFVPDSKFVSRYRRHGIEVYDEAEDLVSHWQPDDISSLIEVEPITQVQAGEAKALHCHAAVGHVIRQGVERMEALHRRYIREAEEDLERAVQNGERFPGEAEFHRSSLKKWQRALSEDRMFATEMGAYK